jgi:hypothetical protein
MTELTQPSNKGKKMHSICIPRIDSRISKNMVFDVFCKMKVGYIEKIYEIPIKNDNNFKRVFLKIKWNNTKMAEYIQQRFDEGLNVKVVHSMPWYWICVSNRVS